LCDGLSPLEIVSESGQKCSSIGIQGNFIAYETKLVLAGMRPRLLHSFRLSSCDV